MAVKKNNGNNGTRVKELREALNLTQAELAKQTGLSYPSIVAYENGNREPNARAMAVLEKFFGVTGEYLLRIADENIPNSEVPSTSLPCTLKSEFSDIISLYSGLDQRGKATVLNCLREQNRLSNLSIEPEKPHIIQLRVSEQAASAGTGIYLGPDAFSDCRVVENALTLRADFAVPISGNSMEPQFRHGDLALVSAEVAEIGDIAVVLLQGEGYIKKLGKYELLSLNPDYDPIPYDETLRVCGKVIGILDPSWIQP